MVKKNRIRDRELKELVDVLEAPYICVWPRPKTILIENGCIRVSYDGSRTVMPLAESGLFTSFARLAAHGNPSEARIKRWVGRFGLPVRDSRPKREDIVPEIDASPEYVPVCMGVDDFRQEAQRAHDLLDLHLVLRSRDARAIKNMVRRLRRNPDEASSAKKEFLEEFRTHTHYLLLNEPHDRRRSNYRKSFPINRDEPGIRGTRTRHREFVDMITVLAAESALGEIATRLISNVRPRVGVQRWEGLIPSWNCPDLYSAIYLQFFMLITKRKPLRFCQNPPCGEPFVPSSSKHIYCSDSCRSNARHYPTA